MAAAATDYILKATRRFSTTIGAAGVADGSVTTVPLTTVVGLATDTGVEITIDRVDASGNLTPSAEEVVRGVVSGSNLTSCVRAVEGSAQAHAAGKIVEQRLTADQWNRLATHILTQHNQDGTHNATTVAMLAGTQTFTGNKTFSGTTDFSTAPKLTFGSEASGDTYYGGADGTVNRLAKGTDGQVLTLASGIPAWATGSSSSAGVQRVRAFRSADQSVNNNSETAIQWNNESFDTDTMHDNATNNTRITLTTAGVYAIGGAISWNGSSTGRRYAYIKLNNTTTLVMFENNALGGSQTTPLILSTIYSFSAADYIEFIVYQNSGGTLGTYVDSLNPSVFWAYRIG